ncbi:free fatty acid receptor 2-like [Tachysurus fulvidraco]|uniref:free fatty acid receptor 2-like n=1 Tax=Tachysurus fulvidraco TaxID=1234273 RepID=UPI000F5119B3|nr:free fatty acid receptor 2-like [Tachysurus fulvidraco]XP_047664853.1 free fatty acid receptor 2-like [Tachysurus fulvidraco]XP_047664855.1 free fatty acid receptor 2-like [Tachysurus fulvidraco]
MPWTKERSYSVLVVDSITLITGLPANLLALYTFIRKVKQRATPLDVLLLSLNISDLLFLLFLPLRIKEAANMKWTVSFFLCPLSGFIYFSTIHNSTLLLTAISVERYLGVAYPVKYKLKRNPRYAVIASIMFWVVSMANCSIVYIVEYHKDNNDTAMELSNRTSCYKEFTSEQLDLLLPVRFELFIVLFCIPFLICCFCYIRFIIILSHLPNINPHKRSRAISLALATLLVFIICFVPFNVSHVVGFITWKSPPWRVYTVLPSSFNACLDPFVFYFSSTAIRGTFNHIMRQFLNWLQRSVCQKFCLQLSRNNGYEERTQSSNDTSR